MIGMEVGGWITLGASIRLSREDIGSEFLKTIFLVSPMIDYGYQKRYEGKIPELNEAQIKLLIKL